MRLSLVPFALFALLATAGIASAAIAPVHYRNAQDTAPDVATIEVLTVKTSLCMFSICKSKTVTVTAKVKAVERSQSGLKAGQTITIVYEHRPLNGMAGPSPIRVLEKGETTPAYLQVKDDGKAPRVWAPAARKASFEAPVTP